MTSKGPTRAQSAPERTVSVGRTAPLSGAPARTEYALGDSQPERERLGRQAAELRADSEVLLNRVGITHGWHAIDVGCGPERILDLLAGRVGPGGWVTGLDVNPATVAAARRFASDRGYRNVEVVEDDARSMSLPSGSYDLVHARTLLVNSTDPPALLTQMVRVAKPGGWVAVMEPDTGGSICYPPDPAWDRMARIWQDVMQAHRLDPHTGRRLHQLLGDAGLVDIGIEARADIYPHGHSRRTVRADLLKSMHSQIVAAGIADDHELNEVDTAVRELLDDPRTLVLPNLLFLAWGRKARAAPGGRELSVPAASHPGAAMPVQGLQDA
jgi:SAM-dependent methyltransferase